MRKVLLSAKSELLYDTLFYKILFNMPSLHFLILPDISKFFPGKSLGKSGSQLFSNIGVIDKETNQFHLMDL